MLFSFLLLMPAAATLTNALQAALPDGAQVEIISQSTASCNGQQYRFNRQNLRVPPAAKPEVVLFWQGTCSASAGQEVGAWVRVRATLTRNVLVAQRDLPAGSALSMEAVAFEPRMLVASAEPDGLSMPAGYRLRRRVKKGEIVQSSLLLPPEDVHRGQVVRVEVVSGNARLQCTGRAESSGSKGEEVLVTNLQTHRRFRAKVTGQQQVKVDANGL